MPAAPASNAFHAPLDFFLHNQDVIQVHKHKLPNVLLEYTVHQSLESSWGICEPEAQHLELVLAITCEKKRKKRKDYASQVWLRALRKGPLTSKLARASLVTIAVFSLSISAIQI
eukprot:257505-Pelagomonas_calceolata.AAC.1